MKTEKKTTAKAALYSSSDLWEALAQQNLVYNSDFRYYSNRVINGSQTDYKCPDGWLYEDPGRNGSIGFNEATLSCRIIKSENEGTMRFSQALHEFPRGRQTLAEKWVTARVSLHISTESKVRVLLDDGTATGEKTQRGPGNFEVEVQLLVTPDAKFLRLIVECDTPFTTILISRAYANIGKVAIKSLPCMVQGIIGERRQYVATETAPAEELSLCAAPKELDADQTRLDSVLNGRFGKGPNKRSLLPDMRGYFSRSWNNGAATDPDAGNRTALGGEVKGDRVSTVEQDEFREHKHGLSFSTDKPILAGKEISTTVIDTTRTSNTQVTGGRETRPKNIAELYTIKWA